MPKNINYNLYESFNYRLLLNEEKGISVNTKPTLDYIRNLCIQSIDAACNEFFNNTDNFDEFTPFGLFIEPFASPKSEFNKKENCIEYFFLYQLPKVQDTLVWLSNLSTILIVCRIYEKEQDLKLHLNKHESMSSFYIIDDNSLKNNLQHNEYKVMLPYISKVIPNYTDSSYIGSKLSIGHLSINFSLAIENIEKIYCGNRLIDSDDFLELEPILQHELNHIHKSKVILTPKYLASYKNLIHNRFNEKESIADFAEITYYANPNECNAFVEQCYKEYLITANKKYDVLSKTFKHIFIPKEERLKIIKNTPTYKKLLYILQDITIYINKHLSNGIENYTLLYLKKNIFKHIVNVFGITKKKDESDFKYVLRILNIFSKNIDKTLKKCERTIDVSESYNVITLDNLYGIY